MFQRQGRVVTGVENTICTRVYEVDEGLHSDYDPGGRSLSVGRGCAFVGMYFMLAIQFFLIRSNMFLAGPQNRDLRFYQGGAMEFEVRITGTLQVYTMKDNEPTTLRITIRQSRRREHQRVLPPAPLLFACRTNS